MSIVKKRAIVIITAIFVCVFFHCAEEPVDRDYFLSGDLVKGGEKPSPVPVIQSVTENGDYVLIDFAGTTTIDPDTGSSAELIYFFYGSTVDPAAGGDSSVYYDEYYYLGGVEHGDLTEMKVSVLVGSYAGRAYIWMTAYDGGRESDHSNVMEIDLN